MRRRSLIPMMFTLILISVGCGKSNPPPPGAAGNPSPSAAKDPPPFDLTGIGGTPKGEDPEVLSHCKKKGWNLWNDRRLIDGRSMVCMAVEKPDKSWEDFTITAEDVKMIARSKTVQHIDIRKAKNLDDAALKILAGIPQLEGIIIGGEVTDAGLQTLGKCKSIHTVGLLSAKKITDAGVKEIAALPKLEVVFLESMTFTGAGFEPLAGSKTLRWVHMRFIEGFTDEGARFLANIPSLVELKIDTSFSESRNLTTAGIRAIAEGHVPARFEFPQNLIDDELFEILVKKGWLYGPTPPGMQMGEKRPATAAEVSSINLDRSKVTDRGLQAILDCVNVENFFLAETGVTDETLKKLSSFKKLRYLALEKTKVTGAGLEAVSALPIRHVAMQGCELSEDVFKAFGKMPSLEELWLSDAKMDAGWLKHIAHLRNLKDLNLRQAAFDDGAATAIGQMPALKDLTISNTALTDKGLEVLVRLPVLKSLEVDGTKVSPQAVEKARKEHPMLQISQ